MTQTTNDLRAQARNLRRDGDYAGARELRHEAMRRELRQARVALQDAQAALEAAVAARTAKAHDALDEGWTKTDIGAALGVSVQRVAQLLEGER